MRRAIALSRRGFPAPNPHVGCVIVNEGENVGEGFHDHAGGPHAEVVALRAAGPRARGATVYVTLEPCNHHGRTPPCAEALAEAGVRRVVLACPDPNPKAKGGAEHLRQVGIEVDEGLLRLEAEKANEQFLASMRLRRPIVVLKAACSLDGRIALPSGESRWITGEASRREAHRLRAECGAVLVGSGTVLADDPELTARIRGVVNQPLRVVLDPSRRLTGHERVFNDRAETLHVDEESKLESGGIDLAALLDRLFARGVTGLLVEGGAKTIGSFLAAGLYDRVELFIAPKVLGAGPAWAEGLRYEALTQVPSLNLKRTRRRGQDLWISFAP